MKISTTESLKKIEVMSKEDEFSLIQILNRKYAVYLKGRFFRLSVSADNFAAYVTVTLLSQDESFYYPVEARVAHKDQGIEPKEAVFAVLDYIDIYFDEYFREAENTFLPVDWTTYTFEDMELDLKAQVKNKKAEDLASQILSGDLPASEVSL